MDKEKLLAQLLLEISGLENISTKSAMLTNVINIRKTTTQDEII